MAMSYPTPVLPPQSIEHHHYDFDYGMALANNQNLASNFAANFDNTFEQHHKNCFSGEASEIGHMKEPLLPSTSCSRKGNTKSKRCSASLTSGKVNLGKKKKGGFAQTDADDTAENALI